MIESVVAEGRDAIMAKLHEFWVLPKGLNQRADELLEYRIATWGELSFAPAAIEEAKELEYFLWDYCRSKEYAATRVNKRMVLESFQSFLPLRTLSRGYVPFNGLPMMDFAVIPHGELSTMAGILSGLPPYAAWRRLRELCLQAMEQGCHLLHRGILPE